MASFRSTRAKQRSMRSSILAMVRQELDYHNWEELQNYYPKLRDIKAEEFSDFAEALLASERATSVLARPKSSSQGRGR